MMQLTLDLERGAERPPVPDDARERWLPIEGWDSYDVSDWGRVRSWAYSKCRIMKLSMRNGRYFGVRIGRNKTEYRTFLVHILVLETFVGPKPPRMYGCHRDDDPSNNRLSNLRWDTPRANQLDRLKNKGGSKTLREADIPVIWQMLLDGMTNREIALEFGISHKNVQVIRSRTSWTYITDQLPPLPEISHEQWKARISRGWKLSQSLSG